MFGREEAVMSCGKVEALPNAAEVAVRLSNLEKQHGQLLEAFNALFDVVVEELGYKAVTVHWYDRAGFLGQFRKSPRQLAFTEPTPELIRTTKPEPEKKPGT